MVAPWILGKNGRHRIADEEFLRCLEVVGLAVDEGAEQETVPDGDDLVLHQRQFLGPIDRLPLPLELVAPHIALVDDGAVDDALAEKIAGGDIGVAELEFQRMFRRHRIGGVIIQHLSQVGGGVDKRTDIKAELLQIDVDPGSDPFDQR